MAEQDSDTKRPAGRLNVRSVGAKAFRVELAGEESASAKITPDVPFVSQGAMRGMDSYASLHSAILAGAQGEHNAGCVEGGGFKGVHGNRPPALVAPGDSADLTASSKAASAAGNYTPRSEGLSGPSQTLGEGVFVGTDIAGDKVRLRHAERQRKALLCTSSSPMLAPLMLDGKIDGEDVEKERGGLKNRILLRKILQHRAFSAFIYLYITYDAFLMGHADVNQERMPLSALHKIVVIDDWTVLVVFTTEMILKMYAYGLGRLPRCCQLWSFKASEVESVNDDSSTCTEEISNIGDHASRRTGYGEEKTAGYFDDSWNLFDFVVAISSLILIPIQYGMNQYEDQSIGQLVRILRIARPLRAFRMFDGTRDVLATFPGAISELSNVLFLLFFVFVVFAILGMNLFGLEGQFHGQCVVKDGYALGTHGLLFKGGYDSEPVCSDETCPDGFKCSCKAQSMAEQDNRLEKSPYAYQDPVTGDTGCLYQPSGRPWAEPYNSEPHCPHYGFECFDNFPLALYTIFTKITLDGWTTSMWYAQDARGNIEGLCFYFTLIFIVTFSIVNINIAIISSGYRRVRDERREINKRAALRSEKKKMLKETQKNKNSTDADLKESLSGVINKMWLYGTARPTRPLNRFSLRMRQITMYPVMVDECGNVVPMDLVYMAAVRNLEIKFGPTYSEWTLIAGPYAPALLAPLPAGMDGVESPNQRQQQEGSVHSDTPDRVYWSLSPETVAFISVAGEGEGGGADSEAVKVGEIERQKNDITAGTVVATGRSVDNKYVSLRGEIDKYLKSTIRVYELGSAAPQESLQMPYFEQVSMVVIVLNLTCMMLQHFDGAPVPVNVVHLASDHCCNRDCSIRNEDECPRGLYKVPPEWERYSQIMEGVFCFFFTVELLIKMVAHWSFRRFLVENWPFNLLDMLIVFCSDAIYLTELVAPAMFNLSVFRLVRILRAFRIVSRFPRLQELVRKAIASFRSILNVLFVLILWHVIATLLGMQIFRCDSRDKEICKLGDNGECPAECSLRAVKSEKGDIVCFYDDEQMWERCTWNEHTNFNSFAPGIVMLVFATTGEGWVEKMETAARTNSSPWPGIIFFLVFYTVSFYLFLNLFIGVILEEFELTDEDKQALQLANFGTSLINGFHKNKKPNARGRALAVQLFRVNNSTKEMIQKTPNDEKLSNKMRKVGSFFSSAGSTCSNEGGTGAKGASRRAGSFLEGSTCSSEGGGGGMGGTRQVWESVESEGAQEGRGGDVLNNNLWSTEKDDGTPKDDEAPDIGLILGCLPPPTPNKSQPDATRNLRGCARDIEEDIKFQIGILSTILLSAIFLGMESPIPEYTLISVSDSQNLDYLCFAVFSSEFIVKILVHGVYWEHPSAYFKQPWNILDFLILFFQLLDLIGIDGLKFLRVMRVLRPLRLLNKIESLRLLVLAIKESASDMFNVLFLWAFMVVVFSICAVNLFAGKLSMCNDDKFVGPLLNTDQLEGSKIGWRENCVGNYYTTTSEDGSFYVAEHMPTPIFKPRVWSNPPASTSQITIHFDNFPMAAQTLFEISTFEDWSDPIFYAVDVTDVGQQPVVWNSPWNVFFFHTWVVMSCFFVLQLVIGVLIDAINQKSGASLFTDLQRNWTRVKGRISMLKPIPREQNITTGFRGKLWKFANDDRTQTGAMAIIVVNISIMASESYEQPAWWSHTTNILNIFFCIFYILELIIRFVAYLHLFFLDPWNLFDLLVVLTSLVEVTLGSVGGGNLASLRTLRLLKVLRAFRLVRRAKRLRNMVLALASSVPSILSTISFICLFLFTVAVLGTQFFSGVREGYGIHQHNNFRTVWKGLQLLMRVITGEDWEIPMRDCAVEPPFCTTDVQAQVATGNPNAIGDCGSSVLSFLIFDMCILVGSFMLLNLFVAVLLEAFMNCQLEGDFFLNASVLQSFQTVWQSFDPTGQGKMTKKKFHNFLEKLHADNNQLGSCVLADEMRYRSVRIELFQGKGEAQGGMGSRSAGEGGGDLRFREVLRVLALNLVGTKALPYPEILMQQERLIYFTQLAAVAKLTTLYRCLKEKHLVMLEEDREEVVREEAEEEEEAMEEEETAAVAVAAEKISAEREVPIPTFTQDIVLKRHFSAAHRVLSRIVMRIVSKAFGKWEREVGVQKMFLARRKAANVRKVGTEAMMQLKTLVQTYEEIIEVSVKKSDEGMSRRHSAPFRNSRNTELDATNRSISRGEHWEITRGEHWEMGQFFGCEPLPSLIPPDEPLIAPGSQSSRMCSPRLSLVETPRTRTPRSPTTRGDAAYESKFTLQSLHSQRGSLLESDALSRTATNAGDAKFTLNSSVNSSAHPRGSATKKQSPREDGFSHKGDVQLTGATGVGEERRDSGDFGGEVFGLKRLRKAASGRYPCDFMNL